MVAIEFEETGRQTPEAAIAQTRVGLLVKDRPPLVTVLVESLPDHGIEHEVHDVVAERAADEKLDRDVIDPLRVLARVGLVRSQPAVGKNVSHRTGGGFVAFARIRIFRLDDVVKLQVPVIERVQRSGEANRADAVLPQEFVGVERTLLRLSENLRVAFHRSALASWSVVSTPICRARARPQRQPARSVGAHAVEAFRLCGAPGGFRARANIAAATSILSPRDAQATPIFGETRRRRLQTLSPAVDVATRATAA